MILFELLKKLQSNIFAAPQSAPPPAPAPASPARVRVSTELLELVENDITRAQNFLDRIENLSEITISDILCAAHSLRLAKAALKSWRTID